MKRRSVFSLVFILSVSLSKIVLATEDAAQLEAATASSFEHATKEAEALGDQRWAFTMKYTSVEKDGTTPSYHLRFDPRRDEGARWTLIEPSEKALSKKEKKAFRQISKSNNADGMLVYDKLGDSVVAGGYISEDEETATFSGQINDEDTPKKIRDALKMEAVLNKAGRYVSKISVTSLEPFSPAPGAKVNKMNQVQSYAPVGPNDEVLLIRSSSIVEGKAFFKAFSSNTTSEYSDFERVDGPTFPEND